MSISVYMNAPIDPELLALRHGMKYIMHHPHEPIIYSKKKISK